MPVVLGDRERSLFSGESGEGAALAMRLVVRAAEVLGANRLIPISRAHVDSCLYHGEATIDFVERLVDGGAQVAVPTSLNVGALDLLHPELWHGDPSAAERGRLLMSHYRTLGCEPTYTCAPYQVPSARPTFGEQVAWGESNAIAFCNSVIGARTERYGDFTDIACAIAARVPDAGLHRTEARRATLVLRLGPEIPSTLMADDSFYPVLGIVLGRRAGSHVAVVDGLPPGLSEERLKAIGAAAASSGSVALFHAAGSTPEAATLEAALQGGQAEETGLISLAELRAARDELTTASSAPGTPIGTVSLGTPHASLAELRAVERELAGKRAAPSVELLVSTARDLLAEAEEEGLAGRLRAAGVELLVDTCSYIAPVLRPSPLPAMTDSGKWAFYAPGNIGVDVVFGSIRECVRSAVEGRVWRDADLWGSA
jgi:predicted aconitase